MSSKRNFYEILNATPSATVEELKVNYKNLILQCHPDKLQQQQQQQQQQTTNESSSSSPSSSSKTINLENDPNYPTTTPPSPQRQEAEFVAITEAWNCLKDPLKRKRYDAELLLNKFHTHSNIYAHIQLKEMKKCLNTEIELEHHDDDGDDDGSAQGGMESDNNNCHELPAYIYTYDCRCGGQYIVDESAEQYCRKVNNSGSSRSAGASSTLNDGGAGVQNDTKETTEGGVGVGGGDEHNNHDQNDDDNDADDDGELIVECSECSLVIILNG